jgi:membrane protein DedA with SNARE-associated domain
MPEVEKWFGRYGKWTLFFGYFIAGLRHFTALTAGMSKVRKSTFAIYAYPGGLVWVVCFISVGYYLGEEWQTLVHRLNRGALILGAVVAIITFAWWWLRRKRQAAG